MIREKRDGVAKRLSPIPAKNKKSDIVGFTPSGKVIVRCNPRQSDAAIGNNYSIVYIVVKSIRFLMQLEIESVELGVTKSPRAEPDFLIFEVERL